MNYARLNYALRLAETIRNAETHALRLEQSAGAVLPALFDSQLRLGWDDETLPASPTPSGMADRHYRKWLAGSE